MHALVLGGAGEVGRHLTRCLAEAPEIDRITIADADSERARAIALRTGSSRVDVAQVDAGDVARVTALAEQTDCLVNCTPFGFFDEVIEAAFAARVDYVDFISEPTAEHLRRAAELGITAISGLGLSPGTSNVLCAHAAAEFDVVEEFHINFASFRPIAPSEGLLDTILWELGSECPTRQYFHNGRFVWVPPFEGSHLVRFPEPVGEQRVFVVPHTETATLPRSFPDVKFVAVRGTWLPELMVDMQVLNKYGLLDSEPVGDGLTSFEATKRRIWQTWGGRREVLPLWSSFVTIEAVGRRGGELVRREYQLSHDPWGTEAVGTTAGIHGAIGVRLLARHGGTGNGFTDPERYFNPHEYVNELQAQPDIQVSWHDGEVDAAARERLIDGATEGIS
jgi:saccharopine dehydrogenase-like NADP-dependent oxidoreductase